MSGRREIIVAGESQSAERLTTYYNTIHPLHRVFDAVIYYDGARQLRSDIDTPALSVGSEWRANRFPSRFTDSRHFRIYEVAGTSHVSLHGMDYIDRQILQGLHARNQARTRGCTRAPRRGGN